MVRNYLAFPLRVDMHVNDIPDESGMLYGTFAFETTCPGCAAFGFTFTPRGDEGRFAAAFTDDVTASL